MASKPSMMRVSSELTNNIKLLKEVKSKDGKTGTHNDMIMLLVNEELRKTHAETEYGFSAVGTVVLGPAGKPIVIKSVGEDKVTFGDGSYVINGSPVCFNMQHLADSVQEFTGTLFNE